MAFVDAIPYMMIGLDTNTSTSFTSLLVDASGEKVAAIFRAPATGSIAKIGFRTVALTTSTSTDVRLETVDTTTMTPTGTLVATNTNATQATLAANTFYILTLTATASVTEGTFYAIVVAPSGTPNYNVAYRSTVITQWTTRCTGPLNYTTSWQYNAGMPVGYVEYTDNTIVTHLIPEDSTPTSIVIDSQGGVEAGFLFKPQFTCKLIGAQFVFSSASGATNDFTLTCYEDTTDVGNRTFPNVSIDVGAPSVLWFTTPITLTAGNTYRICLKSAVTTDTVIFYINTASAAVYTATPLKYFHYTSRTGGAFTDVTSRFMQGSLIISHVETGGGATTPPNSGQFQGAFN